jgi:ACR3 family arsenite efflux pump ArsB
MGFFERYLTVWEFLCIVVGVLIEVPVMLMVANFVNRSRPGTKPGPAS